MLKFTKKKLTCFQSLNCVLNIIMKSSKMFYSTEKGEIQSFNRKKNHNYFTVYINMQITIFHVLYIHVFRLYFPYRPKSAGTSRNTNNKMWKILYSMRFSTSHLVVYGMDTFSSLLNFVYLHETVSPFS